MQASNPGNPVWSSVLNRLSTPRGPDILGLHKHSHKKRMFTEMYCRSKKKKPIYFNTNYSTEMKLVPFIMDYC